MINSSCVISVACSPQNDITYQKKYGDLIIWKDIIKYAKKVDDKRKLIFVTNDGIAEHKNDFLYKKMA
ncbi:MULTISPECIES: PIN-like domain-containing protein [unclassified Mammaliicoccus]|uniref:PIN-like domain-containing protein n=1 Tax=Mammaliicoccus TaxID=2803850 RepID=UPI001EFB35D4|nr:MULTISPECIES: PIN-like domain-containing protein [unclassified Mammaliicoccus]